MTDEQNIREAIRIENRDEVEPLPIAKITGSGWTGFFKEHYGGWSNELFKFLDGHFEGVHSVPSPDELDAELDHWYQQHLIRGLITYSKSIVKKTIEKYSKPTKEIQSIVVALKENHEEPDGIIWHDIYLILSEECRNKSIATIYKGES